ncbi:hypothetical protein [Desulfovibrio inopinatus]|uniref:hypothetical protein n=1 Tax=Desulfovibrio inopinatus TaxID=102109 RepID=UPI000485BC41|nr:hypothetical protein [Desulfovibrio inopinatus]
MSAEEFQPEEVKEVWKHTWQKLHRRNIAYTRCVHNALLPPFSDGFIKFLYSVPLSIFVTVFHFFTPQSTMTWGVLFTLCAVFAVPLLVLQTKRSCPADWVFSGVNCYFVIVAFVFWLGPYWLNHFFEQTQVTGMLCVIFIASVFATAQYSIKGWFMTYSQSIPISRIILLPAVCLVSISLSTLPFKQRIITEFIPFTLLFWADWRSRTSI